MKLKTAEISPLIDHTLLKADATESEIIQLCAEAREHSFYAVCVNPRWIPLATRELQNTAVLPITVVGFPLGASLSRSKARETQECLQAGAREIDMVIDLGALKSGDWTSVESDIRAVVSASGAVPVKVILETCLLSDPEIVSACRASEQAGAAFVKSSTGFSKGGATAHHIRLMRQSVGQRLSVKASGGIRSFALFQEMFEAGANRIGSSASVSILKESQT